MGVDVVAVAEVLHHVLEGGVLALGHEFVEAALRPDLLARGHEDLELGVGEHRGAYVAPVHHYAALPAVFAQFLVHEGAHVGNGGDGADLGTDLHRAYLLLYAALSRAQLALLIEVQVQAGEPLLQQGVYHVALADEPLLACEEGDAAVERPGIEIKEVEFLGNELREGTLAGAGIAVDGDNDVRYVHGKTNIKIIADICSVMKILVIDD